jgi:uncharacterized protein YlxW (UPF0749 family)
MSVGPVRVTASTWIADGVRDGESVIEVDGQVVNPPFEFRAIGDPQTIDVALNIPGGALASIRNAGGSSRLDHRASVSIDQVVDPPEFEYASPVPEE